MLIVLGSSVRIVCERSEQGKLQGRRVEVSNLKRKGGEGGGTKHLWMLFPVGPGIYPEKMVTG